MTAVASIILAAGRARRFQAGPDDSKVLAELAGKPLVRHVVNAALNSHARPVVIVTGQAADRVEVALADLDVTFIRNSDPDAGLSQSLALGLAALPAEISGAVILLADMPYVTATVIDKLIAVFVDAPKEPQAVVPVHAGRRGNPVLLGRTIFAKAMSLEGDRGARTLLEAPGVEIVECPIDDEAVTIDIDTQEALARLRARDQA
ncbi:MAG: NTP transferase domain-containing protein [Beijerinckiaceae bacterium]